MRSRREGSFVRDESRGNAGGPRKSGGLARRARRAPRERQPRFLAKDRARNFDRDARQNCSARTRERAHDAEQANALAARARGARDERARFGGGDRGGARRNRRRGHEDARGLGARRQDTFRISHRRSRGVLDPARARDAVLAAVPTLTSAPNRAALAESLTWFPRDRWMRSPSRTNPRSNRSSRRRGLERSSLLQVAGDLLDAHLFSWTLDEGAKSGNSDQGVGAESWRESNPRFA